MLVGAGSLALVALAGASADVHQAKRAVAHRTQRGAVTTNLLTNSSFEGGTSGWSPYQAALSVVADGVSGSSSARVAESKGFAAYSISSTDTVPSTSGWTYDAAGAVKAASGRRVCLRLREWAGGSVAGSGSSCVTATGAWQQFPAVVYAVRQGGSNVNLDVYVGSAPAGDSFQVDALSVSRDLTGVPVAAPASLAVSAPTTTSLTLGWSASADPRVTGYTVDRTGAPTVTTSGTSTTISNLTCGTTYTFAVAASAGGGLASTPVVASGSTAACPQPAGPTCDFYAAPSGNDAAAGTSAAPFRTATRLVKALTAGQAGCLQPGTYDESITIRNGGTQGSPITLRSVSVSSPAVLKGRLWVAGSDVVVTGLILDGLNANKQPSPAVTGARDTFSNNEVTNENSAICFDIGSDSGYGIATGTLIQGNRIHNCGPLPATNKAHGIYVDAARDTHIVGNWIYDNADRGIQLYPDAQGTLVEHNVLDHNGEGIAFGGSGTSSSGNVVRDNVISNSTIRANVESWWDTGTAPGTGNVVEDNCVWNAATSNIDASAGGFSASGNVVANPGYVGATAENFALAAGSPCAGMGPS